MSHHSNQMPNSNEVVDVNSSYYLGPDFTLRYNPTSGYSVDNGTITSVVTTLKVRTPNGQEFTITRGSNGQYRTDNWGTQVTRRR